MKNHRLFLLGMVIGGAIAFSAVNFPTYIARTGSGSPGSTPPESNTLPRLIATEPVFVVGQTAQETASPAATRQTENTVTSTPPRPTGTPLLLVSGQEPMIIGYSVNGLPLEVYSFGSGEHGRMIAAGIHGGDEWNTVALADQLIIHVDQNPHIIPPDVTLYILRNINPDGEVRAHDKYGRLNSNGVDLNRNFPANWRAEWDRAGCWNYLPTSSGSGPGSEPETRAIMAFLGSHHIEVLLSYQSAALGIFPGGDPWDERSTRLAEALAEVSPYPFPPVDTGCKYSGTLADYAVSTGIAAVDLELSNHVDTDFDVNLNILETLLTFQP